jgi:hypothetical protein
VSDIDLAKEQWSPRVLAREEIFAPGQKYDPARYDTRFPEAEAKVRAGFRGLTSNGDVVPGLFQLRPTGSSLEHVRRALIAILDSLGPTRGPQAQLAIDEPAVHLWHGFFTRRLRHGVALEDMDTEQRHLVEALFEASLSAKGARTVSDIRYTSQLIADLTGLFVDFGENVYWFSVLGDPTGSEPWGWQIDGHHLNLTFVVVGDQVVATPMFLGAEPTAIATGPRAGLRMFDDEYNDGLAVFTSLTGSQRLVALIGEELSGVLTADVAAGPFQDNAEIPYAGISASDLGEEQRVLLTRLIGDYAAYLPSDQAALRQDEIAAHLDDTYFAWIGSADARPPFYFRVHSPVVIIEYEHIYPVGLLGKDPSPNHVHTVVRTPNGNDYGRELIRLHRERFHRSPA